MYQLTHHGLMTQYGVVDVVNIGPSSIVGLLPDSTKPLRGPICLSCCLVAPFSDLDLRQHWFR